jgi:hypothetical protein
MVLRGDTYRREECLGAGRSSAVSYRPAKYDLVVYDRGRGELQLNIGQPMLRRLYRHAFGEWLFDDAEHFREAPRYTLEPLRRDGVASLACEDVPGIERVRLRSVDLEWEGETRFSATLAATDLMLHWGIHPNHRIPRRAKIVGARFEMKFADCKRPRTVEIQAPYRAKYKRDGDPTLVEHWLSSRGFRIHVASGDLVGV